MYDKLVQPLVVLPGDHFNTAEALIPAHLTESIVHSHMDTFLTPEIHSVIRNIAVIILLLTIGVSLVVTAIARKATADEQIVKLQKISHATTYVALFTASIAIIFTTINTTQNEYPGEDKPFEITIMRIAAYVLAIVAVGVAILNGIYKRRYRDAYKRGYENEPGISDKRHALRGLIKKLEWVIFGLFVVAITLLIFSSNL